MNRVLVSVPAWKASESLRRAVVSVLEQTHRDLVLVVTNDGDPSPDVWRCLDGIDDRRLRLVDAPTNRGRYAIDHEQVAAAIAGGYRWWTTLDADDYAEPTWLAGMIELAERDSADVVLAAQHVHGRRGIVVEPAKRWNRRPDLRWHGHLAGLWSVPWLEAHPITNPSARVAWDTVMTSAPFLLGRVALLDEPAYHRVCRDGSLTRSPLSGMGSPARTTVANHYARIWRAAVADRRHALEIFERARRSAEVDAAGIVVTILSGGRPELLADTLGHLPPGLLDTAVVHALANGGDPETVDVYRRHGLAARTVKTAELLPIGPATSLLADRARRSRRPLWLHLEDDWRYVAPDASWLADAVSLLDSDPKIAQVRLRHRREKVLTRHMVTGKPIRWARHRSGHPVAEAHVTTNPSLVRTAELAPLFPVTGERHLQRQAVDAGRLLVAQHKRGAFIHTGDEQSLRRLTGCES